MSEIQVNTINEYTGANGVTIDGALIKDNFLVATAGGGLVKLDSTTGTNVSELTVDTNIDNSLYSQYKIVLEDVKSTTDNVALRLQLLDSSSATITGSFNRGGYYAQLDGTGNGIRTNQIDTDFATLETGNGNGTNDFLNGYMYCRLSDGTNSYNGGIFKHIFHNRTDNKYIVENGWYLQSSTSVSKVKIYMASGNITGSLHIYGVKK
jgi:hypothetical protein